MNDEVLVTKVRSFAMAAWSRLTVLQVERAANAADHVEFVFQDQYLGRNDMWRLGNHLVGQCVYTNQEVTFIGSIAAKIQKIWIAGKQVRVH